MAIFSCVSCVVAFPSGAEFAMVHAALLRKTQLPLLIWALLQPAKPLAEFAAEFLLPILPLVGRTRWTRAAACLPATAAPTAIDAVMGHPATQVPLDWTLENGLVVLECKDPIAHPGLTSCLPSVDPCVSFGGLVVCYPSLYPPQFCATVNGTNAAAPSLTPMPHPNSDARSVSNMNAAVDGGTLG